METGNNKFSAFNRVCLIIISILMVLIIASYFVGRRDQKLESLRKYIFSAEDLKQNQYSFICYEGYYDLEYDFILNLKDKNYKSILLEGGRSINTQNPIVCVKYSLKDKSLDEKAKEASTKNNEGKVVAIVGNSFTYGVGVPSDMSYPEVMNRLETNTRTPKRSFINFGIVDGGIENVRIIAFNKAINSNPSAIVYTFMADDAPALSIINSEIKKPYDLVNRINPFDYYRGAPLFRHFRIQYFGFYSEKIGEDWIKGLYGPENFGGVDKFKKTLMEMNDESRDRGVKFQVAIFPNLVGNKSDYPYEDINIYVKGILKDMGIGYCDLTGAALSVPPPERWVHPLDHHPSAVVHEKVAVALTKCLDTLKSE